MSDELFCSVANGVASDPAPLPFDALTSKGELRTDLAGQYAQGFLTLADLAGMGLWKATLTEAPYDPDTEAPTDLVKTLNTKTKTVACVRGKRALTSEEIAAREAIRNPVPEQVSARQFFQQLAKDGDCTEAEALAYVQTGALPVALSTVIDSLPTGIRFDVRMEVIGANEFYRSTPTVDLVGYLLGKNAVALDRIWRLAAKL